MAHYLLCLNQESTLNTEEEVFTMMSTSALSRITLGMIAGLSATAMLAQAPNPNEVYIRNIVHAGTGCPAGTVAGNVAPYAQAFTLIFDQFLAEAGPGIPASRGRSFCQINLDLHIPQGWSYTLFRVDYRGFASLDSGTQGTQTASYYFQGNSQTVNLRSVLRGYYNRDYTITDQLGIESLVWSPCGVDRSLNIKAGVAVQARGGNSALMTIDSVDGSFRQIYAFRWRRC